MDKNIIETLIVLAANERQETIHQVESMKFIRSNAIKNMPESELYKDLIPEYEANILHYQKCIDQLNSLKSDLDLLEAKYEGLYDHVFELITENNNLKDQLIKLKDFEFPTDDEISNESSAYFYRKPDEDQYDSDMSDFDSGAIWMREQIKSKLS